MRRAARDELKLAEPRRRRTFVLVAAAVFALMAALTLGGVLDASERRTVDTRFSVRGEREPDGRIVLVAVDDATLRRANTVPPIPRGYYARTLDRLHAARLIVLGVQFLGATTPEQDRALRDAIRAAGNVIVATPDTGGAPARMAASAGVDTDADGVLRRMLRRQVALETLAVRAARELGHAPPAGTHAWIDFRGGPGTFPTYSMADVLDGRVPASAFTGRIVLIGVTAPVQKDVFSTAAPGPPMSGIEVHANALQTALDGFPLAPAGLLVELALLLGLVALPVLLALRRSGLAVIGAALALFGGYLIAAQLAFGAGVILPVVRPALALALGCAAIVAADAYLERRQRRALEHFGFLRPARFAFFISYRRADSHAVATSVYQELARRFGAAEIFLDTGRIDAGDAWPRRIQEALLGCSALLVLIGPQWLSERLDAPDDWVRLEIEAGLRQPATVVVPLLLAGAAMPSRAQLPPAIAALAEQQAMALGGADLSAELDELLADLDRTRATRAARDLRQAMVEEPA